MICSGGQITESSKPSYKVSSSVPAVAETRTATLRSKRRIPFEEYYWTWCNIATSKMDDLYGILILDLLKFLFYCSPVALIFSAQCVRMNRCAIAMMFVSPSVCLSGTSVYCDHMVHFSTDLSMSTYSQPFFSTSTRRRSGVWMCKIGMISQERLMIEVKLLLSANICCVNWLSNG